MPGDGGDPKQRLTHTRTQSCTTSRQQPPLTVLTRDPLCYFRGNSAQRNIVLLQELMYYLFVLTNLSLLLVIVSTLQDVCAVLFVFYCIGFVRWMVMHSKNWWDPWPVVLVVSPNLVWALWMAPKMKYDTKSTRGSDDDSHLNKLLLNEPTSE